jgi:hypothetical protein
VREAAAREERSDLCVFREGFRSLGEFFPVDGDGSTRRRWNLGKQ